MATSCPLARSVPLYTCPRLAAATALSEREENTWPRGAPKDRSMLAYATASGKGGTRSCGGGAVHGGLGTGVGRGGDGRAGHASRHEPRQRRGAEQGEAAMQPGKRASVAAGAASPPAGAGWPAGRPAAAGPRGCSAPGPPAGQAATGQAAVAPQQQLCSHLIKGLPRRGGCRAVEDTGCRGLDLTPCSPHACLDVRGPQPLDGGHGLVGSRRHVAVNAVCRGGGRGGASA